MSADMSLRVASSILAVELWHVLPRVPGTTLFGTVRTTARHDPIRVVTFAARLATTNDSLRICFSQLRP